MWMARQQKIPRLGPSKLEVCWFVPDKRIRDNDSLAVFFKAAADALVSEGVWPDDNFNWVTYSGMSIDATQTKNPRIEIYITED